MAEPELERLLAETLNEPGLALPAWTEPVGRVTAAAQRRRHALMASAVAVVVVVVAAVGVTWAAARPSDPTQLHVVATPSPTPSCVRVFADPSSPCLSLRPSSGPAGTHVAFSGSVPARRISLWADQWEHDPFYGLYTDIAPSPEFPDGCELSIPAKGLRIHLDHATGAVTGSFTVGDGGTCKQQPDAGTHRAPPGNYYLFVGSLASVIASFEVTEGAGPPPHRSTVRDGVSYGTLDWADPRHDLHWGVVTFAGQACVDNQPADSPELEILGACTDDSGHAARSAALATDAQIVLLGPAETTTYPQLIDGIRRHGDNGMLVRLVIRHGRITHVTEISLQPRDPAMRLACTDVAAARAADHDWPAVRQALYSAWRHGHTSSNSQFTAALARPGTLYPNDTQTIGEVRDTLTWMCRT
jgi:hypothetical protein